MGADSITVVQQTAGIASRVTPFAPMPSDNQKDAFSDSGANVIGSDRVTVGTTSSHQTLDAMQRLEGMADGLNAAARNIRETGVALDHAAGIVDRMNGELGKIIKNYPPFSLDDEDRKKILMSYSSIRKQIDELTVPSPPAPIYERVQGMWEDLFPKNDGKVAAPSLSDRSSDAAVKTAADTLASTGNAISRVMSAIKASL